MTQVTDQAYHYQAPDKLLAGKHIVVTGAGSGIGRAAALAYAKAGATVILLGKTVAKLESVYDEIVDNHYPEPVICPLDLGSATSDDYRAIADRIREFSGSLDGLLHSAGLLGERKPLANYREQQWLEVMQVNVNAAFMLTKALLPLLQQAANASIIFTSSNVGRQGRAYWGAYAVSKFATEGLMQVWADELANTSNIRINAINPGRVDTAMRRRAYPAEQPANNPSPETVMPLYLYLMGSDSLAVNEQSLDAQRRTA